MRFTLLDEAAGVGGAVAMLAGYGAELLHAVGRGGPDHEAQAPPIGRLYHAVARIAVRRCGLGLGWTYRRRHFLRRGIMDKNQLPTPPEQPAADPLLEELVAFTGLFNPERIWQEEEVLDDMEEKEAQSSAEPALE
jgi:hypothetical protein